MEKKLKINLFLKGIAVFAFVAFCLLAILAGVTLPFVSNASATDSAVASADNTINYDNFTTTLSNCNTTDTYYGFYITEEFYNFVKTYNFEVGVPVFLGSTSFNNSDTGFMFYCSGICDSSNTLEFKVFSISYDFENNIFLFQSNVPYSSTNRAVIFNQGFTFANIYSDNQADAEHIPLGFKDKIKVFTSIPYEEKITIEYKTNLGFQSRFGFVGTMPSSNLYLNLQEKPILPDSLRTIKDSNGNLVNGWTYHDNSYWLPLLSSYDGFGNPVDGRFTGWNVFNFQYNSAGELISQPELNFWFDNLTFTTSVNVNFVDGVLSVPDFTNMSYRYESNFSNSDNLLVYASLDNSYIYYLQSNVIQNDVSKFFALIDYRNYKPLDNDFYVAGYNAAGDANYNNGYNVGYSNGEKAGYNTGFTAGDSKGYQRGLSDSNNYSFLSLFGAIFDAPIQALFGGTQRLPAGTKITDSSGNTITLTSDTIVNRGGMLNFDLMGVNLSGFVLALFSFSIIIIVIKFALSKK